jgi:hypothetical protein
MDFAPGNHLPQIPQVLPLFFSIVTENLIIQILSRSFVVVDEYLLNLGL